MPISVPIIKRSIEVYYKIEGELLRLLSKARVKGGNTKGNEVLHHVHSRDI